jgi:hypothetical protein
MALQLNHIITYNTLLYGTTRDLFNLNRSFEEPARKGDDTYIPGGYVQKDMAYFSPGANQVDVMITIDHDQFSIFEEIMEMARKREIDVILVYTPITTSLYSGYLNNAFLDSLMHSYSEYYNFNEILNLNDTLHFYDSDHLNQSGVDVFNNKLIEILNSR